MNLQTFSIFQIYCIFSIQHTKMWCIFFLHGAFSIFLIKYNTTIYHYLLRLVGFFNSKTLKYKKYIQVLVFRKFLTLYPQISMTNRQICHKSVTYGKSAGYLEQFLELMLYYLFFSSQSIVTMNMNVFPLCVF